MLRSFGWSKFGEVALFLVISAVFLRGGLKRQQGYPFSSGRPMPPRTARIVGFALAFWFLFIAFLRART
jgi:hypothetical protein